MSRRRHGSLAFVCSPAAAQVAAQLPAERAARRARGRVSPPDVALNGRPRRLAPGARIRNQNNMLVMSGALVGSRLLVHYTLDSLGLVKDVWILTPQERAKKPWPATAEAGRSAWSFDPVAQIWTKP